MSGGQGNICEAEAIISRRRRNGVLQFLIKWKNFPMSESTWEPRENILDKTLISDFDRRLGRCPVKEQTKPTKRSRSSSYQGSGIIKNDEDETLATKDDDWSTPYDQDFTPKPKKKRKLSKEQKTSKPARAKKNSIKSTSSSLNTEGRNNQFTENIPPDLMDLDTKYLDTFKQCNLNVEGAISLKNDNQVTENTLPVNLDVWNKSSQIVGSDQQTLAPLNSDGNNEDDFLPSDWDSQDFRSDTSDFDVERLENLTTSDIEAEEDTQQNNSHLKSKADFSNKNGSAFTEEETDSESLSNEMDSENNSEVESVSSDGSDLDFIIKAPDTNNSIANPPRVYRGILHRPIRLQRNASSLQQLLDSGEDVDDPNDPNIIILQPEYVLGLMKVEGELITMIKWKRINIVNAIPAKEMKQMYPELLVEYYENSIKFKR